jgi:predicted nuclease of restriction endonuclease-like (RecB) superfamily
VVEQQEEHGWGSKILEKLALDLQNEFPGLAGFSRANIFHMRAFYTAYEKVEKPSRQLEELPIFSIPWWHNIILIRKSKNLTERLWYAQKTIDNGWSKNAWESAIKSDLYNVDSTSKRIS